MRVNELIEQLEKVKNELADKVQERRGCSREEALRIAGWAHVVEPVNRNLSRDFDAKISLDSMNIFRDWPQYVVKLTKEEVLY